MDSIEEYRAGYIAQMKFVNAHVAAILDDILAQSPDAVIILQGDHGPGSLLNRDSLENSCMYERTAILNAYRFPGQEDAVYPAITPVNSFRLIFDKYFQTQLGLLPDKQYFSTRQHPYQFQDVTAQSQDACALP